MTAAPRAPRTLPPGAAFWTVAAVFVAAMAFTTVPTPLYALYQRRDGFPTVVVTVVFVAYAIGVAASLYLVGHVSDWTGRKPPVAAALVLEIGAAVLFLLSPAVPVLLVARFLTGLGVGALTAAATAQLADLWRARGRDGATPAVVATLANIGGLGLGPLVSGLLAEYAPAPLVTPYLVGLAALVVAGLALLLVPETVPRTRRRWRPQRLAVPGRGRAVFWAAGTGVFAAFAVFGLVTALGPTFLAGEFHAPSRVTAGVVPFGVFASAALVQVFLTPLRLRTQLVVATAAMVSGLLAVAVSGPAGLLPLFVVGALVAGAGVGLLFRASLGVAGGLVGPERRGEVLAAMFLLAYAGITVPVLAAGAALALAPPVPVLVGFCLVVAALVAVAGPRMAARVPR